MDFNSIKRLTTLEQYESVCVRVDELLREASEKGMLESEYDNEYTREIGRLSCLGATYENEYMDFKHLKVKKPTPVHIVRKRQQALTLEFA